MRSRLKLDRYVECTRVLTILDPFEDVLNWLSFMTIEGYVENLIRNVHNSVDCPRVRILSIVDHMRFAVELIKQSQSSSTEISFLPAYYSLLNLAKVVVLLGDDWKELVDLDDDDDNTRKRKANNKRHGATRKGQPREHSDVLFEEVEIKMNGALALFYQTITGRAIADIDERKTLSVSLAQILSLLIDIQYEYKLATNRESGLIQVQAFVDQLNDDKVKVIIELVNVDSRLRDAITDLDVFGGIFEKNDTGFITKEAATSNIEISEIVRGQLKNYLYLDLAGDGSYLPFTGFEDVPNTGIYRKPFLMPEEFTISIFFFLMSTIQRYDPVLMSRLRSSSLWPVFSTARRQSLFKAMLLFWFHARKQQFLIGTDFGNSDLHVPQRRMD